MNINWATGVITVYKTDPFMTFVSGSTYNMDTNGFRLALKDFEDDPIGMSFQDTHRHNTTVLLGGIEYARILEILPPYTITFDDTGGAWVCNLTNSNNNILDRANLTSVQIKSNNSAGLQVVSVATPVIEQADPVLIANAILDSQIGTTRPSGSLGEFLVKKVLTIAKFIGLK